MILVATRLRLRSPRHLPAFQLASFAIIRQALRTPGFREGRTRGELGLVFWTITAWDEAPPIRAFRDEGAHRGAMRSAAGMCKELATARWEAPDGPLPGWDEARRRMNEDGSFWRVEAPSADQEARRVPVPTAGGDFPFRPGPFTVPLMLAGPVLVTVLATGAVAWGIRLALP